MSALPPPPGSISRTAPTPNASTARSKKLEHDDWQSAVIECRDKNIVVEAKAGAGKTTTAIGYTEARKESRFLYLCLNKANQVEATARFGSHVTCRTGHSLAYQAIGHKFQGQLTAKWRPSTFAAEMRIPNSRTAAVMQSVLGAYFSSSDKNLSLVHVLEASAQWGLSPNEYEMILAQSKLAWSKMQQVGSGVSITHDAYLKMWALTNPQLTMYTNIILDEAQDSNPVIAGIVAAQTHAGKLMIGDRHQSIYLFRGALNAMETFAASGATVLTIPRTWRFGPKIADTANQLLNFFKGEETAIIGAGPSSDRRRENKRAVLSRTNAGLFGEAAAVMGKDTYWMGGIENYRVDILGDSYLLKTGRKNEIKDAHLRSYPSWDAFEADVKNTRDGEGRMLINLNEKYGRDIPYLVKCMRANALPTEAGAKLILSTTHRAKGLDWDVVTIGEDFKCLLDALDELKHSELGQLSPETAQEINLLYVGISRARHQCNLNEETTNFLQHIAQHRGDLQEARQKHANASPKPELQLA